MPDRHSLEETERAAAARLANLTLNFPATHALASLYRAANAARSHLTTTALRPHDLTWTGFVVLWLLWIWGSMETREIAESVGISKGTLTGVTNTLVARDLVVRVPSITDRRLVSLALTDEGVRVMEQVFPRVNEAESRLVAGLDPAQVAALTDMLRQIVTTAEEQ